MEYIEDELTTLEKSVGDEFASTEGDACFGLCARVSATSRLRMPIQPQMLDLDAVFATGAWLEHEETLTMVEREVS